jgi:hypothetical protein
MTPSRRSAAPIHRMILRHNTQLPQTPPRHTPRQRLGFPLWRVTMRARVWLFWIYCEGGAQRRAG